MPRLEMDSEDYWDLMIRRSLTRLFLLRELSRQPLHGYEIVRRVRGFSGGCCDPTEGMLYTVLNELEAEGFLEARREVVRGRERKVYALGERGVCAFRTAAAAWARMAPYLMRIAAEAEVLDEPAAKGWTDADHVAQTERFRRHSGAREGGVR